jgi:hypothetical protein
MTAVMGLSSSWIADLVRRGQTNLSQQSVYSPKHHYVTSCDSKRNLTCNNAILDTYFGRTEVFRNQRIVVCLPVKYNQTLASFYKYSCKMTLNLTLTR